MLYNREAALTQDFKHLSYIKPTIAPSQVIRTILYKLQQYPSFRLQSSLEGEVIKMLYKRIDVGALKLYYSTYRNSYFLIKKKTNLGELKKYCLINTIQKFNTITIRNANLPPNTDSFSKAFIGYIISSLVNIFSSYNQILLNVRSQNLISFDTSLSLLYQTILLQGATNSIT